LESSDLDRRSVLKAKNAGANAQNLDRAHSSAGKPKNIGIKDGLRSAPDISSGDFSYEAWYVNPCRASLCARRIVAVKAALSLGQCLSL
jgi:hypothetical protein